MFAFGEDSSRYAPKAIAGAPPEVSRDISASRQRRWSSTSSTCAAFRGLTRRSPKLRAGRSRGSRILRRSNISHGSASPRSRSCRPIRSSTSATCRRSACPTHGVITQSCSARRTRASLPAAGRRSARRPTRCTQPAWKPFSTSSSTTTARVIRPGRRYPSAGSTMRPGSVWTPTIRSSTLTTRAPAIASRSTARWSLRWRSAR